MLFQFSLIIPVYVLVAALMLLLSIRTWTLRPAPGATAWSMTMLFCAIFAIGAGLEIAFVSPVLKLAMDRVIYIGTTGFVFFWGIFAIQYSNRGRWLKRTNVFLLAIIPLVTLCLALFAEYHSLLYRSYEFVYEGDLVMGHVMAYGPFFWIWLGYSYLILTGSWLLLFRSVIRSQTFFRGQAWMVILASVAPMLTYLFHFIGINPLAPFDPTILIMAFSGIVMLLAMKQYRFMDIVPVAYDLIFKNVQSSIILIDLKGRIAGMNSTAEKILKLKENEIIGKLALDVLPQQFAVLGTLQDSKELKTELEMTKEGSFYELQITPVRNRRDEWVGRLVLLYDITARKQIEKQTLELTIERERVQLLQRFISHMSHDLRTPLTSMKVTQYLLRKELAGQHSIRLDSLMQQTERLTEMVESMLTLMRLEKDELGDLFSLNVNELITNVIDRNQALADAAGAQIHFDSGVDLPNVLANTDELTLALSNLVVNAIRYTPSGGEITVSTTLDANHVVIWIRDNGIGISEDDLPHIFERFYRADSARGTHSGGFGLGLSITKTILERHDGSIGVQSHLGEGSAFCVRLPTAVATEQLKSVG
ncbi:MAG: PAS domain-containing protein [Anaerolineaceae bacterium]|nr:PAS domain-containing protein [Anaerolineaceae bacterium]